MPYPIENVEGCSVIRLNGEIDLHNSPEARKLILGCLQRKETTLVDLSAVEYIDSSGVASLVEGLQMARAQQLGFALLAVSKPAMSVLSLARLDRVFPIFPSVQEFKAQA